MSVMVQWYRDSAFYTATWVDWLDIGILALGIYLVLTWLRGTRAFQSLIGMALLVVLYMAAATVGLTTLHWLLDNIFVYAVIALIILFQDDIRRALARAGGTVYGRNKRISDLNMMEEIIGAVFSLAGRRIGALIAIERSASLMPYTEGAHLLDARVSTELLMSLFHPSSPVHDGAVLVCGRRLFSAGVFLPLSHSKQLPKSYGTRHRAAIGFTEETDAVCMLVSEERGTVAVVQGGVVTPVADPNDLRQRLQEYLELAPFSAEVAAD